MHRGSKVLEGPTALRVPLLKELPGVSRRFQESHRCWMFQTESPRCLDWISRFQWVGNLSEESLKAIGRVRNLEQAPVLLERLKYLKTPTEIFKIHGISKRLDSLATSRS